MATFSTDKGIKGVKGTGRRGWKGQQAQRERARPTTDGLRVVIKKIRGVTKGDAADVLSEPYFFQCPPLDSFDTPTRRTIGRYRNFKGKEFTTRGGMDAGQLTFRTIAVEWGSFVSEYDYDVENLVRDLRRIVRAGYPVEVIATHRHNDRPEWHADMFLEAVVPSEVAGEPDARYIDLTFSVWHDPTVQRRRHAHRYDLPGTIYLNKDGSYRFVDEGGVRRDISFMKGELTLAKIARAFYGRVGKARALAARQKPPIKDFGMHTPLRQHPRFKKDGGKIIVPNIQSASGDRDGVQNYRPGDGKNDGDEGWDSEQH